MENSLQESGQKPVVLVVDDQKTVIHALAHLLKEDYHVLVAINGARALELATGDKIPDVILLDVMLPDMDGYEVCRRLKNDPLTKNSPHAYSPIADHITVSVGHATRQAVPDQSPQDALKAADQALYKAKEAGRNRVWEG